MSKRSSAPRAALGPVPDSAPLIYGEDAFAMVNRHHEEFKALRRKVMAEQQERREQS